MKIRNILLLLPLALMLFGCVNKGDIKNNFCGIHLNYQYCKCAFHGEYCAAVGMGRGEAKIYVYEKYDKWKNPVLNIEKNCEKENGYMKGKTCVKCDSDEEVSNNRCVLIEEKEEEKTTGECKYDSDCDSVCEGDIMWKRGCNPRENECIKTFETDCSADIEIIADLSFSKTCSAGECIRNQDLIDAKREELEQTQKEISDEVKELNASRDDLKTALLDANKNCLNGLADMTNVAIVEFATRTASILAGGLPDIASVSVDYINDGINKLYGYLDNAEPSEERKLKPAEYIKLNCDLYKYFIGLQEASDKELENLLERANTLEEQINAL